MNNISQRIPFERNRLKKFKRKVRVKKDLIYKGELENDINEESSLNKNSIDPSEIVSPEELSHDSIDSETYYKMINRNHLEKNIENHDNRTQTFERHGKKNKSMIMKINKFKQLSDYFENYSKISKHKFDWSFEKMNNFIDYKHSENSIVRIWLHNKNKKGNQNRFRKLFVLNLNGII